MRTILIHFLFILLMGSTANPQAFPPAGMKAVNCIVQMPLSISWPGADTSFLYRDTSTVYFYKNKVLEKLFVYSYDFSFTVSLDVDSSQEEHTAPKEQQPGYRKKAYYFLYKQGRAAGYYTGGFEGEGKKEALDGREEDRFGGVGIMVSKRMSRWGLTQVEANWAGDTWIEKYSITPGPGPDADTGYTDLGKIYDTLYLYYSKRLRGIDYPIVPTLHKKDDLTLTRVRLTGSDAPSDSLFSNDAVLELQETAVDSPEEVWHWFHQYRALKKKSRAYKELP